MLGALGASSLGNILAGKGERATSQGRGVNRAGEGVITKKQGQGIVRPGY